MKIMKIPCIFSLKFFIHFKTLLKKQKQGIYNSNSFTIIKINLKIIMKELLNSLDLSKVLIFYIHKLKVFIIVSKKKILIFIIFWVMLLDFIASFNKNNIL